MLIERMDTRSGELPGIGECCHGQNSVEVNISCTRCTARCRCNGCIDRRSSMKSRSWGNVLQDDLLLLQTEIIHSHSLTLYPANMTMN